MFQSSRGGNMGSSVPGVPGSSSSSGPTSLAPPPPAIVPTLSPSPEELRLTRDVLSEVLFLLMDLSQTVQQLAAAVSATLEKLSQKLSAYAELMTQIPTAPVRDIVPGAAGASDQLTIRQQQNTRYSNWLEAIKANKGIIEDKAKKVQTILQSANDFANNKLSSLLDSILDCMKNIIAKMYR